MATISSTGTIEAIVEFDFAVDLARFQQLANIIFSAAESSTAATLIGTSS